MAESRALLAAMKLRQQQKADAYREEQRALLESGAGPTTTSGGSYDVETSPFPIIGEAAVNDATAYGEQVGEAFMPEAERSYRGLTNLVGNNPFNPMGGAAMKFAADPIGGLNATGDMTFGALNAFSAPLAPPVAKVLQPALESETGQGFVSGLSALGDEIEGATGISKQNQLDAAMWLGAPVAGHYGAQAVKSVAKPFTGMAERILKPKVEAPPPTPKLEGVPALEHELEVGRAITNETRGRNQRPLREADPAVDLPDEVASDAFKTMRGTIRKGEEDRAAVERLVKYYSDRGAEHVGPPKPRPLASDASKASPETAMPETGEALAQQYRDWAKREGAHIDDAISMLDNEKEAWPKELYDEAAIILSKEADPAFFDQSRTPLYNQISAQQKAKLNPLAELDGGDVSPRMTPESVRDDYASSGTLWGSRPLKPDQAKAPGLADVKVKPGQSLWEVMGGGKPKPAAKSFQAGDDFLRQAKIATPKPSPNVPRTVTVMPEGKMDGRSSGARNVEIVTTPTVQDLAKAAERSSYGEARFLIEPDGVIHTWTADAGWHADMGEFLGADVDGSYRGLVTSRDIRSAQLNGAKTLNDVIEFTQRGAYWKDWKSEAGLDQLPEWQASAQALADSYSPKGQAKQFTPEDDKLLRDLDPDFSPLEQLDSGAIDNAPKNWKQRREDRTLAMQDDARPKRPLKKGEPSFNTKLGYMRDEARGRSPVEQLDNPDPMSGEVAAARARSADMNAYKAEQPAATKPERAADMKQRLRQEWLNPDRPTTSNFVDKPLPSITTAVKKVDPAFVKSREGAFEAHEGDISPTKLAEKVSKGLEEHIGMTPEQRRVNLREAEKRLLDYMPNLGGRPSEFMNENKKLMKTRIGYDGGEPVTLPNGQSIESTGLSLSPSTEMKGFKTCPNSAACREACLGLKSGQYYLGGEEGGPQVASRYRTTALLSAPEAAAVKIFEEIAARRRKAAANGNVLGVRMNVLSDVDPKVWKPIIEHFNDVIFYDYTKMKYEPIAPNHHYTYSSTGVSSDMVSNKNANWSQMRNRLDAGDNVAMAFSTKEAFPKWVVDEETGKRYRVVDGVSHDFRPIDLQDANKEGVIVGLKNMDLSTKEATADISSGGFIVKYEPNWKREGKTGKGKMSRDEQGNPIAQNDTVYIQAQPSKESTRSAKPGESGAKTGPQTAISVGGKNRTPLANMQMKGAPYDEGAHGDFVTHTDEGSSFSGFGEDVDPRSSSVQNKLKRNVRDAADFKVEKELQQYLEQGNPVHPRSFKRDYPTLEGVLGEKLTKTIDGDDIQPGSLVVGRREVGGKDRSATPSRLSRAVLKMMREKNPDAEIKFSFDEDPNSNYGIYNSALLTTRKGHEIEPTNITINTAKGDDMIAQALGHESGHAVERQSLNKNFDRNVAYLNRRGEDIGPPASEFDEIGILNRKDVPYDVMEELPEIYHDIFPNKDEVSGMVTPGQLGYGKASHQPEMLAEALRLYFYHPEKIKAEYPATAKWLRSIVNKDPSINKHITLNEAGGGLAGVMAMKYLAEQQEQQGNR